MFALSTRRSVPLLHPSECVWRCVTSSSLCSRQQGLELGAGLRKEGGSQREGAPRAVGERTGEP